MEYQLVSELKPVIGLLYPCHISFFVTCSLSIINCKVSLSLRRVIQMLFTLLSGLERQDMSSSQGLVMVTSSGGTSGV